MSRAPYDFSAGETPVLISVPHAGTDVPDEITARLTDAASLLPDTDWYVDRLYAFARDLGAGMLVARTSRFVADLNRNPTGEALYPGTDNTEVCPLRTFADQPIYRPGGEPDDEEIERRVATHWRPYHARLAEELAGLRDRFGVAVLFDAHSIHSRVPRFFEGLLPHFNLGTAGGTSAAAALRDRMAAYLAAAEGYTSVVDGRFKGGYITRTYGRPDEGVHAIQLEMAWRAYMSELPPFAWNDRAAGRLRPVVEGFVTALIDWAEAEAMAAGPLGG